MIPTLTNEQILMTTQDGKVVLTTHRVVEETEKASEELMLSEYVSFEIIIRRIKFYKLVSLGFLLVAVAFAILSQLNIQMAVSPETFRGLVATSFIAFLATFVLYVASANKHLKLTAASNSVEFSIHNLRRLFVHKFIISLIVESEKRKKEAVRISNLLINNEMATAC